MPHIHTKPGQHDATASAYIIRTDLPEPALVMHEHKLLKQYLQFGGHIELHENPWQTLVHEVLEESGYDMDQLQILQPTIRLKEVEGVVLHPCPVSYLTHQFKDMDHFHTDIAFAFVTTQKPRHTVGTGESQTFTMFTAPALRKLAAGTIPENVRATGLFVLEECLPSWELCTLAAY